MKLCCFQEMDGTGGIMSSKISQTEKIQHILSHRFRPKKKNDINVKQELLGHGKQWEGARQKKRMMEG
jgi:hypothetical protein